MEQIRPVEIQNVLTTNETITLLLNREKWQILSYLTYNWSFSFEFLQIYSKYQKNLDFNGFYYINGLIGIEVGRNIFTMQSFLPVHLVIPFPSKCFKTYMSICRKVILICHLSIVSLLHCYGSPFIHFLKLIHQNARLDV